MASYKQKCTRCKKNYVLVKSWRERYPTCFQCQENELKGEITDPEMKKLLGIPDEYYKDNSFLRNIKVNYLRYGKLSEKQIEAFKKTVEDIKNPKEKKKKSIKR